MNFLKESIIYYSVKLFSYLIKTVPVELALAFGRMIGSMAYLFDAKRRTQVYANLKIAFAQSKSPQELKQITRQCFKSYGMNLIELFRIPNISEKNRFDDVVTIEGKEHIDEALKAGKGVILLAMHFGSWEIASFSCGMLGHPYHVIVKPQKKNSRLDELLNSFRTSGGQSVLSRGMGTRDILRNLKNNEIIGMVVDQGGRDGALVPFFGRKASMSVGAIRIGIKQEVPVCFAVIIREDGPKHRVILHKPFDLVHTGNADEDVEKNLKQVTALMENYISRYPSEYMWFYKIWKYSNEAHVVLLTDQITGHTRQTQAVASACRTALNERHIQSFEKEIKIAYKGRFAQTIFSLLSVVIRPFIYQGKTGFLKWFLSAESVKQIYSMKPDFIISTGSSLAPLNAILSREHKAKSICVLKPGLFSVNKFDMVVLPLHDVPKHAAQVFKTEDQLPLCVCYAAPNLITDEYLSGQKEKLLAHFTHLQNKFRMKLGVFIGGDAKHVLVSETQARILISHLKKAASEINAEILATSSRRTPKAIEQILYRELKKDTQCPLLIIANQLNSPEAVGGILAMSDINIVSGDSISMISEAASAGKNTIVFYPDIKPGVSSHNIKQNEFIKNLDKNGYIYACNIKDLERAIYDMAKGKIQTKRLDDHAIVLEAVRYVI